MKNNILTAIVLLGLAASASAQNLNWQAFQPGQNQAVYIQAGWDYGATFGAGYAYRFDLKMPVLANIEFSAPAGKDLFDDFKVRIGGQVEAFRSGSFAATARIYSPIRRYQNNEVTLFNFGGEFAALAGFYRPKWFVAGEFGFDKAIATHVKPSAQARENYPDIQGGWYVPTGGNFFYELQTGFSLGANDISLKAGKVIAQDFKTQPFVPFSLQVGYLRRF